MKILSYEIYWYSIGFSQRERTLVSDKWGLVALNFACFEILNYSASSSVKRLTFWSLILSSVLFVRPLSAELATLAAQGERSKLRDLMPTDVHPRHGPSPRQQQYEKEFSGLAYHKDPLLARRCLEKASAPGKGKAILNCIFKSLPREPQESSRSNNVNGSAIGVTARTPVDGITREKFGASPALTVTTIFDRALRGSPLKSVAGAQTAKDTKDRSTLSPITATSSEQNEFSHLPPRYGQPSQYDRDNRAMMIADQLAKEPATFSLAEKRYKQLLSRSPTNSDLWSKLGRMQAFQNNYSEAAKSYKKALDVNPNAYDALLGSFNLALWQGKFKDAQIILDRLSYLYPENSEVLLASIHLLQAQYRHRKAINIIRQYLTSHPANADFYLALGESQSALLEDRKAKLSFQEALLLRPDDPTITRNLTRKVRPRWALTVNTLYSQLQPPYTNWHEGGINLRYRKNDRTTLIGGFGQSRRFGQSDRTIAFTVLHQIRKNQWAYVGSSWTPAAKFSARYSVSAGWSGLFVHDFPIPITLSVDGKLDRYDNGFVKSAWISLKQSFLQDKVGFTVSSLNTIDQENKLSAGFKLLGELAISDIVRLNGGFSQSAEASGDVLRTTRTLFSGLSFDLTDDLNVVISTAREKRVMSYHRRVYDLAITRKF